MYSSLRDPGSRVAEVPGSKEMRGVRGSLGSWPMESTRGALRQAQDSIVRHDWVELSTYSDGSTPQAGCTSIDLTYGVTLGRGPVVLRVGADAP